MVVTCYSLFFSSYGGELCSYYISLRSEYNFFPFVTNHRIHYILLYDASTIMIK